ncbi:MAG: mandelate racemase/muconate lactonizing enzyme family protein [Streptosporangiaceae bacterium]|nr:mandelate racemase/muconate lactonizing enzyme family protein [Streptosporangiaceae bacterium]
MHIVDVRTVLLTGPATDDPWLSVFKQSRTVALVEIETDGGIVGLGETYAGYFFPESVPLVVAYLKPILLALEEFEPDTLDVPLALARMRTCFQYWGRVGLGAGVLAGIEGALWDLAGKLQGLPVHRLFTDEAPGSLPAYATGGPSPWPKDDLIRKVAFYRELGFSAFKVSTGYIDGATREEVVATGPEQAAAMEAEKVELLRSEFGTELGVLLDGHMGHREGPTRWNLATASAVLTALELLGLVFLEEPLAYDDPDAYAELAASSRIPVAGGEQLSTSREFAAFAERRAFTIAQPDAAWLGIEGFLQVADRFARDGAGIAPHCWSGGVGYMQNIHAAFASNNVVIVELPPAAGPLHTELWGDSVRLEGGALLRPEEPGLGVRLTDAMRSAYPFRAGAEEFSSVPGKLMRS